MHMFARALLVGLAVVVCAWFALGCVQARDTRRATSLLTSTTALSVKQAERARSLLESAGTMNPDLTVEILRGVLEMDRHRYAAAERTLLSVTEREPMNVDAWAQLVFAAASNGDRRLAVLAGARALALHPKPN
jgi:predicted Zn-dependent protease